MTLQLSELRRAGHSTTHRAWFTNPVRRAAFAVIRPYLQELTRFINELATEAARDPVPPPEAPHDLSGAMQGIDAALNALRLYADGLHKDQLALNHRLASLEDATEQAAGTAASIEEMRGMLRSMQDEHTRLLGRINAIEKTRKNAKAG